MANISTEGMQEHLKAGKVFHWSRWIVSWEIQLFLQILVEDQLKFASYLHVNRHVIISNKEKVINSKQK